MVERMNCIQNQITIANRILMRNKVSIFIITGGQDNIQAVAGQMLGFFGEIGCNFPQFPYIAHSRGWTAEDMERNIEVVKHSRELRDGARALVNRAVDMAQLLLDHEEAPHRGGGRQHAARRSLRTRVREQIRNKLEIRMTEFRNASRET